MLGSKMPQDIVHHKQQRGQSSGTSAHPRYTWVLQITYTSWKSAFSEPLGSIVYIMSDRQANKIGSQIGKQSHTRLTVCLGWGDITVPPEWPPQPHASPGNISSCPELFHLGAIRVQGKVWGQKAHRFFHTAVLTALASPCGTLPIPL